jgi:hypothetical protein
MLKAGPWLPDLPVFNNPGQHNVQNAVPASPQSFGPVRSLVPQTGPLDSVCRGSIAAQDVMGNTWVFAGTATKLWGRKNFGAWQDLSGTAYSLGAGESWRFDQFKNWIIATDYADPVAYYDMAGSNPAFIALAPMPGDGSGAPLARHVAVIDQFVVLGNTSEPIGGVAPYRSWWSGIDNATSWPIPGSATAQEQQADYNDIVGAEGGITGLVSALNNSDGAMFYARGLFRIVFAGPPNTFDFQPVSGARGTICPNAIVHVGGMAYYIGEDGFYAFDGAQSIPIGANQVDMWFFANINPALLSSVVGAWDPVRRLITWAFPGAGSPTLSGLIFFSPILERWGTAVLPVEWLVRVLSGTGQQQALAAFDPGHSLSLFSGATLAATLGTAEGELFPGRSAYVRGIRPLVDGGTPSAYISTRMRPMDTLAVAAPAAMDATGVCPQRAEGRFARAHVMTAIGDEWTHFSGVEVDAVPAGMR